MRKSKSDETIEDWRSTGRRRARGALFDSRQDYQCIDCGITSRTPPKDAPRFFEDIWPEAMRTASQLQADHRTKDLTSNHIDDLCWRCPPCHKVADMATAKGVAQSSDNVADEYIAAYGKLL